MKTEWDCTQLADACLKRPDYAPSALQRLFRIAGLRQGHRVCHIGAGVAHLPLPLAAFECRVDAVKPNDASLGRESIAIPYTTRAWIAQRKD